MEKLKEIQRRALEITGLDTKHTSPKGWIYGKCPFCGHPSKFGMKLNPGTGKYKNLISFNCFSGGCQEKGSEYNLFPHFNLGYLLKQKEFISTDLTLDNELNTSYDIQEILIETDVRPLPLGWTRIYDHPYLRDRGWEDWQFETYKVGTSNLYSPLKNYIIILMEEEGSNRGYVARSTMSKEWIDNYNTQVKVYNKTVSDDNKRRYHPKYSNQGGVYFERLLGGYDEITHNTDTIILVEGYFDKSNTDKVLGLNLSEKVKCNCTFGKKISSAQIKKLKLKGIKNILLLYDPDAIAASKQFAFELDREFNTKITTHPNKDPGEMNLTDFNEVFSLAKTPIQYYINMLE